jgi:hypothetical protein
MLGGEATSLASQLTQTFGMHTFGAGRIEADPTQDCKLF